MDELIRKDQDQYKKYEELLLRRDQLQKEAGSIHTAYIKKFGELILEDFELKVECIKKKKMIGFCQAALNRAMPIDLAEMKTFIQKAMALYNLELQEMLGNKKRAEGAKRSPDFQIERSKRIYRRLAKALHPDIHPETAAIPEIAELWTRIVIAYHVNDDEELENLEILVRRVLREQGVKMAVTDISDLEERIERLEGELNEILTTAPYIYAEMLEDPEQVERKKEEFHKEIDEYRAYSKELSDVLRNLLCEGGAEFVWIQD